MYGGTQMKIAGLNKNDFTNGIGVTVSLFLQGCPHHCPGCQNPETWDPDGGTEIDDKQLIQEIANALVANGIMRGLAISGGDPLATYNRRFTLELIQLLKYIYPGLDIYIWTGYSTAKALEILKPLPCLTGITCITEPFILAERDITLPLRGSRNQQIIKLPDLNITSQFEK